MVDLVGLQGLVKFLVWEISKSFIVNFLLVRVNSEQFTPDGASSFVFHAFLAEESPEQVLLGEVLLDIFLP